MKKGTIPADIAETLLELGKSTTKQSAKAINRTFNPLKIIEKTAGGDIVQDPITGEHISKETIPNSTQVDINQLKKQYSNQDTMELGRMRNRLFKLVKEGEEKAIFDRKKEVGERRHTEQIEDEEKKKKQTQATQQPGDIPQSKQRRSIFSAQKKKAQELHPEIIPSTSKG